MASASSPSSPVPSPVAVSRKPTARDRIAAKRARELLDSAIKQPASKKQPVAMQPQPHGAFPVGSSPTLPARPQQPVAHAADAADDDDAEQEEGENQHDAQHDDEEGDGGEDEDGGDSDDDGGEDGEDGEGGEEEQQEELPEELAAELNVAVRLPCQLQAAEAAGGATDGGCYRFTFLPRTQKARAGERFPRSASKYGGAPFLLPGEEAGARCSCGSVMSFMFQLRADELPARLGQSLLPHSLRAAERSGLFQYWQCSNHSAHPPQPGLHTQERGARWIDCTGQSVESAVEVGMQGGQLLVEREMRITGWTERQDVPAQLELEDVWQLNCDWLEATPYWGDKLSGLPPWIQDPSYPVCPQCEQRMELFMQLTESIFHNVFEFVALFVCPTHREEFASDFQCG